MTWRLVKSLESSHNSTSQMNNASPVTTSNYDRRPEQVRRQALGKLHVPYTQRALLPARKVKA